MRHSIFISLGLFLVPRLNAYDFDSVAEESGSLFGELHYTARVAVEYAVESK